MATVEPQAAPKGAAAATARALTLTNPYMKGPDVTEAQQLLQKKGFDPGEIDGEFGPQTAAATKQAKWALGFPDTSCDMVFGERIRAALKGELKLPADFANRAEARKHDRQKSMTMRQKIVEIAKWGAKNEPQIHYRQSRPIDGINDAHKLPLYTDCSGFVTLCYRWAGGPDPNGLNYCGQGYTGTLLDHGRKIAKGAVQPGDYVVWGGGTGHHVAIVIEAGADPMLVSHGQEKGPFAIRFSEECKYQPKQVTWLACIP